MNRRRIALVALLVAAVAALSCSRTADGSPDESAGGEQQAEAAALVAPADGSPSAGGEARAKVDPNAAYAEKCPSGSAPSLECEWLRRLVVASLTDGLLRLEMSRDQRGAEVAMAALGVRDEPEVLIAACRVLGQFPETPGLAEKVVPLFDNPYHSVQQIAADVVARLPDPGLNTMASKWRDNHSGVQVRTPYDQLGVPAAYDSMGFPSYPGAQRYTPGDSDRSVGWWSPDPPSEVAQRLATTLGVDVMTYEQWTTRSQQEMVAAFTPDKAKVAEMQSLMEKYMKTQDAKLMERVQKLQAEMSAPMEQASADAEKAMTNVATPSGAAAYDQTFYLIAEEKPGHVARAVLVYRQPTVERTVIQMNWNLRDYPPAWN